MQKETIGWIVCGGAAALLLAILLLVASATSSLPSGMTSWSAATTKLSSGEMMGHDGEYVLSDDVAMMNSAATSRMIGIVPPEMPPTAGATAAEADQKIIRTGFLSLTVESVADVSPKIIALATANGGYVQNTSVNEDLDGRHSGDVVIRVPSAKFDATVSAIKAFATVVNVETTSGQDVTEQYSDLEAQLRNAQAQEAQYLEILKKATTVEETLNVQQYLSGVRYQVESLQGQIKYVSNATSYSTITVSLSEKPGLRAPTKGFDIVSTIKEAAQALVAVVQSLGVALVWLVIVGGGIVVPVGLVAWGIVSAVRKARNKKK